MFIDVMNSHMIPIMNESSEMRNAMTLMMCHHPRCTNHISWPQNLDRSFMNWVSHRVSEMGHLMLGISNSECMKLGAGTFDDLVSKVRLCIEPILVNNMTTDNFTKKLEFAQRCYQIDYEAREMRHPSSGYPPLCGEGLDEKHLFRRDLARALSMVISDWIISGEEDSNAMIL